jgi:hypothetical protein
MSVNSGPNTRAGKPINVNDQITVVGFVTNVGAQAGVNSLITIQLAGSGLSIVAQAQDCAASAQTL